MADHLRNQIRDRVVVALTGLNTTGSNVYQTPLLTPEEQTLPALVVYIDSEISGETATMTNINRECLLHVDGYVEASATVLDTLDLISKEVEIKLATVGIVNSAGASIVQDHYLTSTDIEIMTDETRPLGVVSMAYFVQYRTTFNAPDVAV
jgi:hypothetical protein